MFAIEDKEQEKQNEEETVKQIAIAVEAVTKATKRRKEKARPEARIQAKKYDSVQVKRDSLMAKQKNGKRRQNFIIIHLMFVKKSVIFYLIVQYNPCQIFWFDRPKKYE